MGRTGNQKIVAATFRHDISYHLFGKYGRRTRKYVGGRKLAEIRYFLADFTPLSALAFPPFDTLEYVDLRLQSLAVRLLSRTAFQPVGNPIPETRDAGQGRPEAHQAHCRRPRGRRQGRRLLGPGPQGLRHPGLCPRAKDVRRADARPERAEARDARALRRSNGGRGPQASRRSHRPHQARAGAVSGAGRAGTHGGEPGGALHGGPCEGQPPGEDAGELPLHDRGAHPAGARRAAHKRGRPVAGGEVPLRAARDAAGGEPGGEDPVANVRHGGGAGTGPAGAEPVPGGAAVQGSQARAVPDAGRVPRAGPGSEESGGGRLGAVVGGRRASPADADRMPQERTLGAAMGRRGPGGARVEIERCQGRGRASSR